ncbi:MAG: nylB, partial [Firmicutes bacterium]|nr:nylB [Bacillota bacterium]
ATCKQSDNSVNGDGDWGQGYGYQFWRCRHNAYRGDGAFGQYCIVIPEYDVVLAITGGMRDLQKPLEIVWDKLLPGFGDQELPESTDYELLKKKLSSLKLLMPVGEEHSSYESKVNGKRYQLESNPFSMEEISGQFHSQALTLTIKADQKELHYEVGIGEWKQGTFFFEGKSEPIVFTGIWESEDTLLLQARLIEMPFAFSIRCQFSEDKLLLSQNLNVGFEDPKPININGKLILE